jgi:hypothetical protein
MNTIQRITGVGAIAVCANVCLWAQAGIAGQVRDQSGAILPEVEVQASSPALIEKTRTVKTDSRGEYKIVDLRPGTYQVTFRLPGFTTLQRNDVELTTDFVANVSAELQVGREQQTVEVRAEISGVDVQSSTQQSVMTRQSMDTIPTGHSVFSNGQLLPGATLSRPDVGGSTGMQQASFQVHGSQLGDISFQIDGMVVNSNYGNGAQVGVYYNDGMIQETSYQTSAIPAEVEAGGIRINMIPREGGNQFHGSFYGTGATGALETTNCCSASQVQQGLKSGSRFDSIYDINGSVGGPIRRDRLWFFSTFRRWSVNEFVANTFNPDGSPALDDSHITSGILRLTAQLNANNKLSAYYDKNVKWRGHRRDTSSLYQYIAPEASIIQLTPLGYDAQVKWVSTLSPKLVLDAGLSLFFLDYSYSYQPGVGAGAIATIDIAQSTLNNAAWYLYRSYATRRYVSTTLSYVTGSHSLKVGFQDGFGPYRETYGMNGDLRVGFNNGTPSVGYQFNTPVDIRENLKADLGIFAQDSFTFHRVTLNAGVRFDYFNTGILDQSAPAGAWVPARSFKAIDDVPSWKNVVPRLGLSWDLFGKGKTAIKASASKYDSIQGVGFAQTFDPMFLTSQTCAWNPPAGTTPASMANGLSVITPSQFSNCTGFSGSVNTHMDPNIARPYTWEYTFGVQHELLSRFVVTAMYFFRQNRDQLGIKNTLVTPADYSPVVITNPLTGSPLTVYNQSSATQGKLFLQFDNYVEQNTDYNGFEIQARKQFTRGGLITTAFTVGEKRGSIRSTTDDLNNPNLLINRIGAVELDSTYQFRVNGFYPLPWGFQISGTFTHQTGIPFAPVYSVTRSIVPGLTQNVQPVNLVPAGVQRLPEVNLLDLRLTRTFKFGERLTIEPVMDIYNTLNVSTPLSQVATVGPNLGRAVSNTEGRLFRLGVKANF